MVEVTIVPLERGRYAVRLAAETIVENSRDPEHAAARALLARGITGLMTTVGQDGKPRMHLNIEKAAGLTVNEDDRGLHVRPWKPFSFTPIKP